MKRRTIYIALSVTLSAIILVGAYAILELYILVPEAKADIDMQLVYANFWTSTNTDNNGNISTDYTSYITVISVTNHASKTAFITDVTIMLAQNVIVYHPNANSPHVFSPGMQILVAGVSLSDQRDGLELQLEPGSYRLVAVTGLTTRPEVIGSTELFMKVNAEPAYVEGISTSVYDIKELSTFQHASNDTLYNALLAGNQTLSIDGHDASINYSVSINYP